MIQSQKNDSRDKEDVSFYEPDFLPMSKDKIESTQIPPADAEDNSAHKPTAAFRTDPRPSNLTKSDNVVTEGIVSYQNSTAQTNFNSTALLVANSTNKSPTSSHYNSTNVSITTNLKQIRNSTDDIIEVIPSTRNHSHSNNISHDGFNLTLNAKNVNETNINHTQVYSVLVSHTNSHIKESNITKQVKNETVTKNQTVIDKNSTHSHAALLSNNSSLTTKHNKKLENITHEEKSNGLSNNHRVNREQQISAKHKRKEKEEEQLTDSEKIERNLYKKIINISISLIVIGLLMGIMLGLILVMFLNSKT